MRAWDLEKEDKRDRDTMIDRRMVALTMFADQAGWPIAKSKGVANYVRKVLAQLTPGELALMLPTKLQELAEHAGEGYDSFVERRNQGRARARARVS